MYFSRAQGTFIPDLFLYFFAFAASQRNRRISRVYVRHRVMVLKKEMCPIVFVSFKTYYILNVLNVVYTVGVFGILPKQIEKHWIVVVFVRVRL